MDGTTYGGRYQIIEKVGSGGMAEVYRGFDSTLGRNVAIKVLHRQYAQEPGFVARFRHEAQAAAGLNHPNVVSVHDWGSEDDIYYLIMEFLNGRNLKEIIGERGPLSLELIVDIGRQVAAALQYAHKHNIIHRDVKPHNIFITDDGEVKVTDFGIARSGSSTLTQTGSVLGTAHYLSPEQAQGEEIGLTSDVYSLGVVLYEMATGRVPFEGDSPVAVALKHVHEMPTSPRSLNPDVPENLDSVILRAMAKHPADRYQSAAELREDLGRVTEGLPVNRVSPGGDETVVIPRVTSRAPAQAAPPSRSRAPVWLAVGTLLALLLATASWGVMAYVRTTNTKVPELVGKTETAARKAVKKSQLGLRVSGREFSDTVPKGEILAQSPDGGGQVPVGSVVSITVSKGKERIVVPALLRMTREQATFALAKANLSLGTIRREYSEDVEEDTVMDQAPSPGTRVDKNYPVDLWISRGPQPLKVPDLVGKTVDEALGLLRQQGLIVQRADQFDEAAAGTVIDQSPADGVPIKRGEAVSITVSRGPETVEVPDVSGKLEAQAKAELEALGFTVVVKTGVSKPLEYGKVVNQNPAGKSQVRKNATVTIWVGAPADEAD